MYIKNNGFTLDWSSISKQSTSKAKICLPYAGPLPSDLDGAKNAAITIMFQVGLIVNVNLNIERAGKMVSLPIIATPEEVSHILQPFFFDESGHTRRCTGLNQYNLGLNQSSYINWKRLVLDTGGIDTFFSQLSPASIKRASQYINHNENI